MLKDWTVEKQSKFAKKQQNSAKHNLHFSKTMAPSSLLKKQSPGRGSGGAAEGVVLPDTARVVLRSSRVQRGPRVYNVTPVTPVTQSPP